jgi:hypothetical protein
MLLTLNHAENLAQRRNLFKPELLRTLRTVLGAALLAVLDALSIENTADDVVTHAGKSFTRPPRIMTTECS